MISAHKAQPYFEMYETAAHQLCYGGPGNHGSLKALLGPLRQDRDRRTGVAYVLERPRNFPAEELSQRVSEWNLDFTLPVEIHVIRGDQSMITVEEFVGALVFHMDPEKAEKENIGDSHISALSSAIRATYEAGWLTHQQRKVTERAKAHRGKRGSDVDDEAFRNLVVDTTLRAANVEALKEEMRDHVREAYGIARYYPGTADEIMHDRALLALTRPEFEVGQYAMSPEDATSILFGLRSEA